MQVFLPALIWFGFSLFTSAENISVIASIAPDLYILDVDGNHKRLDHLALTFNSHVTLVCRTTPVNEQLLWHYSEFGSDQLSPVLASAHLSIDRTKRGETALELKRVHFAMAGIYQCSNRVASRQINIHVYGIRNALSTTVRLIPKREHVGPMFFDTFVIDTREKPTVACQFQVGPHGVRYTSVRWKGGKLSTHPKLYELVEKADEIHGYVWSNLTIKDPTFDQTLYGKYTCQFNIISGSMESAEVEIVVPPVVKRAEGDMGYYSDKLFAYKCQAIAYPPIIGSVQWSRGEHIIQLDDRGYAQDEDYNWGGRVRVETEQNPDDRIVFDPLKRDDRGVYSCFVKSPLGNATGAFFLRVKDRWAVIWPLIGIGLEVTVLFVVILLYELRRRAMAKNRDADDATFGGAKTTSSSIGHHSPEGDTSLRHRPVRL